MNRFYSSLTLASLIILLNACNVLATPTHSPLVPGLAQTIAAQTLSLQEAMSSHKKVTQSPAESPIPTFAYKAEFTPAPTSTPVPMLTPFNNATQTGAAANEPCVNAAEFIKDITIPDDTRVKAGQSFVKMWEFKNVGTCTWTPDYALIFIWGDRMGGQSPKPIGFSVLPGQTIVLSVELTAPKDMPSCQGNWMFIDSTGERFGTGYDARNFFWVSVIIAGGRNSLYGSCGGGG